MRIVCRAFARFFALQVSETFLSGEHLTVQSCRESRQELHSLQGKRFSDYDGRVSSVSGAAGGGCSIQCRARAITTAWQRFRAFSFRAMRSI